MSALALQENADSVAIFLQFVGLGSLLRSEFYAGHLHTGLDLQIASKKRTDAAARTHFLKWNAAFFVVL